MNPEIKEKADFFSNSLRNRLGSHIDKIVLFGSRARGDYRMGSDYDFLIVVDQKNQNVREEINSTAVDFLDRYDELAASILYDRDEWNRKRGFPIGINIEKEGIVL